MNANGLHQTGVEDLIMPEDRLTQQLLEEVAQDHACEDTINLVGSW